MISRFCWIAAVVIGLTQFVAAAEGTTEIAAPVVAPAPKPTPGLEPGTPAPPLRGGAWFSADDKAPILSGKVCLIDFWFAKCYWCVKAIPHVKDYLNKYGDKGLVVVAPGLDDDEVVKQFRIDNAIPYAMLSNARSTAAAYGVKGFPTMFVVGKDGKILWKGHHPETDPDFIKILEDALAVK